MSDVGGRRATGTGRACIFGVDAGAEGIIGLVGGEGLLETLLGFLVAACIRFSGGG